MSDKRVNNGGSRPNAGRKPKSTEEDLRRLFDETWPEAERKKTIKTHIELANMGDAKAFRLLMAYAFGTPRSGDELRIEEAVDDAIENQLTQLEANLTPSAWREVEDALGIESNREAQAGQDSQSNFEEPEE